MQNTMALIKNPYIIGRPIYDPEYLFGRETIVSFIQDRLTSRAKVIVLHGQRRIGITSCMNYISRYVSVDGFVFFPLSLEDKHHYSLDEILYDFARDIVDWLGISGSTITIPSRQDLKVDAQEFFGIFLQHIYDRLEGKNIVLLVDEFDVLWDDESTKKNPLINFLTSIINRDKKIFIILFVGRQGNSLEFVNYLFGEVPHQELGLLNKSDTEKLITEVAEGILDYESEAIDEIWELAGGHPYYTQLLCFSLFQQARNLNRWNVTRQDVEGIIDESLVKGEAAFVSPLGILSPREKLILSAVAEAQEIATEYSESNIFNSLVILERHHGKLTKKMKEELTKAAEHLVYLGFLQKIGEQELGKKIVPVYKVKIELLRRWLLKPDSLKIEIEKIKELFPQKSLIEKIWYSGLFNWGRSHNN
ncbi:MAG: ATP-binding protein [Okeania sp. SIO3B5]|uniref:ATP-binding protein n=1 Tax=Okeania sp. SIO3B5 TaxID=2607811 RepID=UPI0013FE6637|nr:ATP-binding protein [Okeania sp. SIO3B5]NEO57809.1 ATP-binding protein [Okeania sp. SIO3B5]